MIIVSVDPGGTTGLCILSRNLQDKFKFMELPDEHGAAPHHLALWGQLAALGPAEVVCEEFNYQRREINKGVSLELVSKEYIGIVQLYCEKMGIPLYRQNPGVGLPFWSDDKIEILVKKSIFPAFILEYKWRHARDGLKHMLYNLAFEKEEKKWIELLKS